MGPNQREPQGVSFITSDFTLSPGLIKAQEDFQ